MSLRHHPQDQTGDAQEQDRVAPLRNPLDLPELLLLVSRFLSVNDLARCLRVSCVWHETLLPFIWDEISLFPSEVKHGPSFDLVQKHATLITSIKAHDNSSKRVRELLECPNLTSLNIGYFRDRSHSWGSFIHRHRQTLTSLTTSQHTNTKRLDAIIECTNLEQLGLHGLRLENHGQWLDLYERLWYRVKVLSLSGPWCPTKATDGFVHASQETLTSVAERTGLARIENLFIGGVEPEAAVLQAHVWVIRQCPSLTRLEWASCDHELEYGTMHLLANEIRSGHRWERLEALMLPFLEFLPEDFAVVVEAIPRGLTELGMFETNFDLECWTILRSVTRHLSTLTTLELFECSELESSAIQSMMCEMPQLKCFKAHLITDTAIINDSRPWVCQGLERLQLAFQLDKSSSQPMILERLSELKKLRMCFLYNGHRDYKGKLQLTIEHGLEQLRTLRQLSTFRGPDHNVVDWGEVEAHWVLKHWPMVQELFGFRLSQEAQSLLPGIRYFSYYNERDSGSRR